MTAIFYFKDNTTLKIFGNYGSYNNKTFDMSFRDDVRAEYLDSKLFAEKADFSNTKTVIPQGTNVSFIRKKDIKNVLNKIDPKAHIKRIFAYSPNQNIAYIIPEYSV